MIGTQGWHSNHSHTRDSRIEVINRIAIQQATAVTHTLDIKGKAPLAEFRHKDGTAATHKLEIQEQV